MQAIATLFSAFPDSRPFHRLVFGFICAFLHHPVISCLSAFLVRLMYLGSPLPLPHSLPWQTITSSVGRSIAIVMC